MSPPFWIRTAGRIDPERFPRHSTLGTHERHVMLTAFVGGTGHYRNSTTSITVTKGMVGLVPPEDRGVLISDPSDPYTHYWCRFGGGYAIRLARQIIAERGTRFFPCEDTQEIAELIGRMGEQEYNEQPDHMGHSEVLLAAALTLLLQPRPEIRKRVTATAVEQYLRERVAEPLDLGAAAHHFAMSKTSLRRASKRFFGCTLLRATERMKVDWAKALLDLGLSVGEVALRVGYEDAFYFSRVFKKHVGISPKKWAMAHSRST